MDNKKFKISLTMAGAVSVGAFRGWRDGSLAMLNVVDAAHQYVNKDNPFGKHNRFYQSMIDPFPNKD